MPHEPAHIIRLDRRGKLTCDTLSANVLGEIQAAYKAQPWYSDKLARKAFRRRIHELMRREGRGIVIIGPGMSFEPPPPFMEFFEPIQLGTNDPQLLTLSGSKPTRQESVMKILIVLGLLGALAGLIPLLIAFLRGQTRVVSIIVLAVGATTVFMCVLIYVIQRIAGKWYLLPAAVAVRTRAAKGNPLILLTPLDCAATLRWVSNGKSSMLMLELWREDCKCWRRAVSEREAISFLAAWRSDETAPPIEKLIEVLAS